MPKNSITITLEAEDEDCTAAHQERTYGYTKGFAKSVKEVQSKADGKWGWCSVKITAIVKSKGSTYVGNAYLGGCSYHSAEDFALHSAYFAEKVAEAIRDSQAPNIEKADTLADAARRC